MATSFNGWLDSWGDSWGPRAFDPNAVSGVARVTFSAIGVLEGIYLPVEPPEGGGCEWYDRRRIRVTRKKRENDEAFLLFVM